MYNSCKKPCRLCNRLVISNSVTVITVGGVDTLVIDIPAGVYRNCEKYCIVVAQSIPTTATISMPVAISIGGVTTTVYPLTTRNCVQVVACQLRTRTKYETFVYTSATGGTFRVMNCLPCAPDNTLVSLPIAATPAPTVFITRKAVAKEQTTTENSSKKEVQK